MLSGPRQIFCNAIVAGETPPACTSAEETIGGEAGNSDRTASPRKKGAVNTNSLELRETTR